MSEFKNNAFSSRGYHGDGRCSKCGIILMENHTCTAWMGQIQSYKSRSTHRPKCISVREEKTFTVGSVAFERKSNAFRTIGTQTDAVPNSSTSVGTQTKDIDQHEYNHELLANIMEKMTLHRRILRDLSEMSTKLQLLHNSL